MQKNSTSSHQDSVYTFKDICFTVPAKGADGKPTEKKILSNISARSPENFPFEPNHSPTTAALPVPTRPLVPTTMATVHRC